MSTPCNVHNHWPSHDAPDSIEDAVDEEENSSPRALTQSPPELNENMFLKAASKTGAKISLKRPTTNRSAPDLEGSDDAENESSVGPQIPAKGTGRMARTRSKTALLPVLEETVEDPPEASHDLEDQYLPTKSAKGYTYVSPSNIKVPESDQYRNRIEEARNLVSEPKKTSRKTSSAKTSISTKPPVSKRGKGTGARKVKVGPKGAQKKTLDHIPAALLELSPSKRRFSENNETEAFDDGQEGDLESEEESPAKRKEDKHVVEKEDQDADHLEDLSDVSPGNKSAGYVE